MRFQLAEAARFARVPATTLRWWARKGYLRPIAIAAGRVERKIDENGMLAISLMVWLRKEGWPPSDASRAVAILLAAGRLNRVRPKREAWLLRDRWQVYLFESSRSLFARLRQIGGGNAVRVDHFLHVEGERLP